jgi:hypothetical protein
MPLFGRDPDQCFEFLRETLRDPADVVAQTSVARR